MTRRFALCVATALCLTWITDPVGAQQLKNDQRGGNRPVIALVGGDEWELSKRAEQRKNQPDIDYLLRVSLPPNPTRGEVIDYVNVIYLLSRNQRTELASDPQVTMLAQVGRENLDVLLASSAPGVPMAKYGIHAIGMIAQEQDQQWVFDHLAQNRELMTVIQLRGWCKAAMPMLESMLAKGGKFVSQEVIECLLENPNKRYYPAIKKFFVTASNAHSVHRLIKTLPGLDLTKELPQAWEYSRGDGNPFAVSYLMPDVLAVGYLPAFRFLFEALERERDGDRRIATFDSASMIRQYSFATGEKAELKAWYAKNKYSLSFDHQSGRFVSAEDRQHMDKR